MQRFSIYLSFFTISIIVLLAIVTLFTDLLEDNVPGNMKYVLGSVLLLYATMRVFRARRMWLKMKYEEKNETL
jgi:low temperature requirement protein LtrA